MARATKFKPGDLVKLTESEWEPPLVDGPYDDWIGIVVSVKWTWSTKGRSSPAYKILIQGEKSAELEMYDHQLDLVMEAK